MSRGELTKGQMATYPTFASTRSAVRCFVTSGLNYGEKDMWKRWVFGLEWKTEGVTDGESEDGDYDEQVICVTCAVRMVRCFVTPLQIRNRMSLLSYFQHMETFPSD